MQVFSAPKRNGKTELAVELAVMTDSYLCVKDRREADRLHQIYNKLRLPITYQDLLERRMAGSFIKNVVIDNIDDFTCHVCRNFGVTPLLGTIDQDFPSRGRIFENLKFSTEIKRQRNKNKNIERGNKWEV